MAQMLTPHTYMRRWLYIALAWGIIFGMTGALRPIFAQKKPLTVAAGLAAFEQEAYETCISIYTHLLTDSTLSERDLVPTHYFLGQSYWMVSQDEKLQKEFPRAISRAHTHLRTAQVLDDGPLGEFAQESLELIWPYLYNQGVDAYNIQAYSTAWSYFMLVSQIDREDHRNQLALSYTHWHLGDTSAAVHIWQKLRQDYQLVKGQPASPALVRTYELLARYHFLELDREKNTEPVLAQVEHPTSALPVHWEIPLTDLKVYKDYPLGPNETIDFFEETVRKFPDDHQTRLHYASWLYKQGNQAGALQMYKAVIQRDGQQQEAHLRLAAHYINLAIKISQQDPTSKEIQRILTTAYPHLQALHRLQPDGKETLERLAQVANYLDQPEASSYQQALQEWESPNR